MNKQRGFEVVQDEHRTAKEVYKSDAGKTFEKYADITLPTRADEESAGYDFYTPVDIELLPAQKKLVFTDVKAFMQKGEMLELYIRSSLAVKKGVMLSNCVGIVDKSYYSNESNDGNIGIALVNTSGKTVKISAGERIAQGIFKEYLVADKDEVQNDKRVGGIGSSGK